MNYLKIKRRLLLDILILFLISLVPLLWFKSQQVVVGLDSGYSINYIQYFQQRVFTWFAPHNFGADMSIEIGAVIYSAFPAFVKALGVSDYNVQKVVFVSWFFIISLSMYWLANYIFPKKINGQLEF